MNDNKIVAGATDNTEDKVENKKEQNIISEYSRKAKLDEIKIKSLESEVRHITEECNIWYDRAIAGQEAERTLNFKMAEYLTMFPNCKYRIIPVTETKCNLINKETNQIVLYDCGIISAREFLEEEVIRK